MMEPLATPNGPSVLNPWVLGLQSSSAASPSEETEPTPGAAAIRKEGSVGRAGSALSVKACVGGLDVLDKHLDVCISIHSAIVSGGSPARIRLRTMSHCSGSLLIRARMSALPCRCSVRSLSISDRRWSLVLHFLSS